MKSTQTVDGFFLGDVVHHLWHVERDPAIRRTSGKTPPTSDHRFTWSASAVISVRTPPYTEFHAVGVTPRPFGNRPSTVTWTQKNRVAYPSTSRWNLTYGTQPYPTHPARLAMVSRCKDQADVESHRKPGLPSSEQGSRTRADRCPKYACLDHDVGDC